MNVLRVNYESQNAQLQCAESMKNTGFAVLENHPIDEALIQDVYQEWREFFNNPSKNNYRFNPETQDGFFPTSISETAKGATVKDIKEYFQYYPWGQYPESLTNKTKLLYQALTDLAATVLYWLEAELPDAIQSSLSMPLSEMIKDSEQTMLRILHYPPLSEHEQPSAIRAAAHEDINLITVLVAATEPGLQVKNKQGHWLDVPCVPDSLVLNIGDMLALATKQYYQSTTHQVINPTGNNIARLSMPLFLHPRPEVRLSPEKTAGEYLRERLIELGVY
jgi:isopenicillin N synthase-like dioxygenase